MTEPIKFETGGIVSFDRAIQGEDFTALLLIARRQCQAALAIPAEKLQGIKGTATRATVEHFTVRNAINPSSEHVRRFIKKMLDHASFGQYRAERGRMLMSEYRRVRTVRRPNFAMRTKHNEKALVSIPRIPDLRFDFRSKSQDGAHKRHLASRNARIW